MKKYFPGSFRTSLQALMTFLIFSGAVLVAQTDTRDPIAPLAPDELLPYLPPTPQGWDLIQSDACNFFGSWKTTVATRKFKLTPPLPPGGDANVPQNQPKTTMISVSDGGYYRGTTAGFENFKPGEEKDTQKLMIQGCPAIETKQKDKEPERLEVLVENRFVVSIETSNQNSGATEKWFSQINVSGLTSIADSAGKPLRPPMVMSYVNELDPSKSHSYVLQVHLGG